MSAESLGCEIEVSAEVAESEGCDTEVFAESAIDSAVQLKMSGYDNMFDFHKLDMSEADDGE